jgi:hypothetical protein
MKIIDFVGGNDFGSTTHNVIVRIVGNTIVITMW